MKETGTVIEELEERLIFIGPDNQRFTARTGLSIRPFMEKIIIGIPYLCNDCRDKCCDCVPDIMDDIKDLQFDLAVSGDEKQECLDELEAERTRSRELESTIVLLESRIRELERRST